jgi:hypothetical protein
MISIILPTHNEPTAKKMLAQTKNEFPDDEIIQVNDTKGIGKGNSIRAGFSRAKNSIVCYIDGDGDIHPRMLKRLLPFTDEYDIVVGSKNIEGLFWRKIITLLSRVYIKIMFGIPVETQTGIKVFKKIPTWETNGFAFDIEILAKAKKSGWNMVEVPITARITKNVSFKVVIKTFLESLKIKYMLLKKS